MSLSAVQGTLLSLKSCQADMGTGMDIVTDVATDLAEAQGKTQTALSLKMTFPLQLCSFLTSLLDVFTALYLQYNFNSK